MQTRSITKLSLHSPKCGLFCIFFHLFNKKSTNKFVYTDFMPIFTLSNNKRGKTRTNQNNIMEIFSFNDFVGYVLESHRREADRRSFTVFPISTNFSPTPEIIEEPTEEEIHQKELAVARRGGRHVCCPKRWGLKRLSINFYKDAVKYNKGIIYVQKSRTSTIQAYADAWIELVEAAKENQEIKRFFGL